MSNYTSDGRKLIDIEYDDIPAMNDTVDGMRVLSTDKKSEDENALFLLELNGNITCYVLDEVFILGKVSGFHNLAEAMKAWHNDEI